jgi:hypothetical protein
VKTKQQAFLQEPDNSAFLCKALDHFLEIISSRIPLAIYNIPPDIERAGILLQPYGRLMADG